MKRRTVNDSVLAERDAVRYGNFTGKRAQAMRFADGVYGFKVISTSKTTAPLLSEETCLTVLKSRAAGNFRELENLLASLNLGYTRRSVGDKRETIGIKGEPPKTAERREKYTVPGQDATARVVEFPDGRHGFELVWEGDEQPFMRVQTLLSRVACETALASRAGKLLRPMIRDLRKLGLAVEE